MAGAYRSLLPTELLTPGPCLVSEALDGETWFLHCDAGVASLLSPAGRVITGIPATDEASTRLGSWSGLMAGELYAARGDGRPRVHDLHAAMSGGASAQTGRLRFAAFDLLRDGESATSSTRPTLLAPSASLGSCTGARSSTVSVA